MLENKPNTRTFNKPSSNTVQAHSHRNNTALFACGHKVPSTGSTGHTHHPSTAAVVQPCTGLDAGLHTADPPRDTDTMANADTSMPSSSTNWQFAP